MTHGVQEESQAWNRARHQRSWRRAVLAVKQQSGIVSGMISGMMDLLDCGGMWRTTPLSVPCGNSHCCSHNSCGASMHVCC